MSEPRCRICGESGNAATYAVRERMFGSVQEFRYFQCVRCGVRQLVEIPKTLAEFYPDTYASHRPRPEGGVRTVIRRLRNAAHLQLNPVGWLLAWAMPHPSLAAIGRLRPERHHRILDIGCGYGTVLRRLAELGFGQLTGIDPFIPDAVVGQRDGVVILKCDVEQLPSRPPWDLILVNHVIEHVADPVAMLNCVRELLGPTGRCLIRTPIADSWAAEHFGPAWVQHDAPRHLIIQTERSLSLAAQAAGLRTVDSWYDSTAFQFWGSEAYVRGEALVQQPAWAEGPGVGALLSPKSLHDRLRAGRLNRARRGDQACFVLVKA